jgi:hypothetical protein
MWRQGQQGILLLAEFEHVHCACEHITSDCCWPIKCRTRYAFFGITASTPTPVDTIVVLRRSPCSKSASPKQLPLRCTANNIFGINGRYVSPGLSMISSNVPAAFSALSATSLSSFCETGPSFTREPALVATVMRFDAVVMTCDKRQG